MIKRMKGLHTPARQILDERRLTETSAGCGDRISHSPTQPYSQTNFTSTPNLVTLESLRKISDLSQLANPNLLSRRRSKGALITAVSRAPSSVHSRHENSPGVTSPLVLRHKQTKSLADTAPKMLVTRESLKTRCSGDYGKWKPQPKRIPHPHLDSEIASPIRTSNKPPESWTDVEKMLTGQDVSTDPDAYKSHLNLTLSKRKSEQQFRFSSQPLISRPSQFEDLKKTKPPAVVELDPSVIQRGLALQKMQEFQKLKRRLTEHRPTIVFGLALQKKPAIVVKQNPAESPLHNHAAASNPSRIFQVQTQAGKTVHAKVDNFRVKDKAESNFSTLRTGESFESSPGRRSKRGGKPSQSSQQYEPSAVAFSLEKYDSTEAFLLAHRCRHFLEATYEQFSTKHEEHKLNNTMKDLLGIDGDPKNPLRELLFYENSLRARAISELNALALFQHITELRRTEFLDELATENFSGTFQPSNGSKGERLQLNPSEKELPTAAANTLDIRWPIGKFRNSIRSGAEPPVKPKLKILVAKNSHSSLDLSISKRDSNSPEMVHKNNDKNQARFLLESPRQRTQQSQHKKSLFAGPPVLDAAHLNRYKVKPFFFEALRQFTESLGKHLSASRSAKHTVSSAVLGEKLATISRVSSILRTKQTLAKRGRSDLFEYFGSSNAMRDVPVCQEIAERTLDTFDLGMFLRKVEVEGRFKLGVTDSARKDNKQAIAVLQELPTKLG